MTAPINCLRCGKVLESVEAGLASPRVCLRCLAAMPVGESVVAEAKTPQEATVEYDPFATQVEGSTTRGAAESVRDSAGETAAHLGRIGRFELQSVLGQGGFGRVYRAFDPQLQRLVALKVPRFAPDEPEQVERFLGEARAAARLRHPNLVAVFESDRAGDEYYIASEFVQGQPLSEHIRQNQPDFRKAAEWVRDLALALAYAHGEGVVHRDIKPANILLDRDGRPQLTDFGLAKRVGEDATHTADGTVMGTPAYMAPEQARGKIADVGPQSDQYSLGVVLYELLSGRCPFQGSPHQVLSQVISDDPPLPGQFRADVPRDLEAICLKAMAREPARRYPGAAELAADLDRFLAGATVLARRPGWSERTRRWLWRRRQPVLLVAGVAVAVLVTLCIVWLNGGFKRQAPPEGPDPEVEKQRRKMTARSQSLSTIGLAIHSSASATGYLPQPAIYGKDGTPLLSWRVAILPYLDQKNLYSKFHLDEPWDSPHNRELLQHMPKVYEIPDTKTPKPSMTFYQVPVSPGGAFEADPKRQIRLGDVQDDHGSTLLVVEAGDPVEWTRPADLAIVPGKPLPRIGDPSLEGFGVCFLNGSVQLLKKEICDDDKLLRALISRSGGELVNLRPFEVDPLRKPPPVATKDPPPDKPKDDGTPKPPPTPPPDPQVAMREARNKNTSKNNLRQLFVALQNYADRTSGNLPPPAIYGKDGKPLLSWRVAILPSLGQKVLYDRFKRDEPWDSPANRELIPFMPKVFAIADIPMKDPNTTYYQLFVGPGAFETGANSRRALRSIGDGAGHTLAIVEGGEAVPWTAPVDLAFAPGGPLPKLGGPFADGFNAVFFDGTVKSFKKEIYSNEPVLRALIGWNDGEVVSVRPYLEPLFPSLPKDSPAIAGIESVRRAQTLNKLRQLAIAIHLYHETHNRLPPHAIADKDGKPLLSWRVAILPFLDENLLYKKFKLDEPWDSEHNKALLPLMPDLFESPGAEIDDPSKTFYQLFVGPGAGFERDPKRRVRFPDITRGVSNTLMMAEARTPVPWTAPEDLFFESGGPMPKLGGPFPDGFHVALFDGRVRFLTNKEFEDKNKLRALIQIRADSPPVPR